MKENKVQARSEYPKQKEVKKAKNINVVIKCVLGWVRQWILPPVALAALAGLAVKGIMVYLPALDEKASLVIAVMSVVMLLTVSLDKE